MKDNKKLEEFLNTKVGELGKKYFESFMEEGKKIVVFTTIIQMI